MKQLSIAALLMLSLVCFGETYRLKYVTSVDIIEDGKSVGTRKLKPGTLVEIAAEKSSSESTTSSDRPTPQSSGGKLCISKISPVMFKTTRQAAPHVLNAEIRLDDYYIGPYENKNKEFWSINVNAYNSNWDGLEIFRGYARKTSPVGRQIAKELADGAEHKCRAKLLYVKNPDYDDIVLLEAFELVSGNE